MSQEVRDFLNSLLSRKLWLAISGVIAILATATDKTDAINKIVVIVVGYLTANTAEKFAK